MEEKLLDWHFWLDAPFRVLLIFLGALVLTAVLRLVIRNVTRGIARGSRSRIVRKIDNGKARWVADAGLASDRQSQRASTVGSVLSSVAVIVIWAVAILMIIAELGFNIAPVLASAGIAGTDARPARNLALDLPQRFVVHQIPPSMSLPHASL